MQPQTAVNNQIDNNNSAKLAPLAKKSKKPYPRDFKHQIIAVYQSGMYATVEACAVAYGVSSKTLYSWLSSHNKKVTPIAIAEQQVEVANLKKELAKAKMENEILKKAAIYFANQAR